jgi:signal peptidase I
MRPTLSGPGSVEVDYDAYDARGPALGEIVVFQGPASQIEACAAPARRSPCPTPMPDYGDKFLIKRVVALPGDRVAVARDGRVIRNGRFARQRSIRRCLLVDVCALPRPVAVPAGHYFVMGDNRRNSFDSRDFGPVPREAIDGQVTAP